MTDKELVTLPKYFKNSFELQEENFGQESAKFKILQQWSMQSEYKQEKDESLLDSKVNLTCTDQ